MSPAHPQPDPGAGMSWPALDGLARVYGDALFVFDGAEFRANVSALRTAMAAAATDVELAYSIKANNTPAVCRLALTLGMMVEVSSPMELWLVERLGIPGPRIVPATYALGVTGGHCDGTEGLPPSFAGSRSTTRST